MWLTVYYCDALHPLQTVKSFLFQNIRIVLCLQFWLNICFNFYDNLLRIKPLSLNASQSLYHRATSPGPHDPLPTTFQLSVTLPLGSADTLAGKKLL